jgi:hypothetical protein
MSSKKISPVIFAGLLFALILVSACTDTSQPPESPAPAQTPAVPVTAATSGTSGALVTTEIPAITNIPGNPSCSPGQALCDGSCIDTQSDSQHCGACGNVCNTGEPCSEGTCLSWAGSWVDQWGWEYEMTQTGTLVNGTDSYKQIIISGSTSGNPPRLTCTWVQGRGKLSDPCTFDMAPDGKSYTGSLLGCNVFTTYRQ